MSTDERFANRVSFLAGRAGRRLTLGVALGVTVGALTIAGCHSDSATTDASQAATAAADAPTDPADANMAPATGSGTQVLSSSQQAQPTQSSQSYNQPAAPIERRAPAQSADQGYSDQGNSNYDQNAEAGYDATLTDEQATAPPPPLPVYEQPPAPDPNYLWTPGYWAFGPGGYYWVPGAWCAAPYTGAPWTPG
jgi:hypothetical protein